MTAPVRPASTKTYGKEYFILVMAIAASTSIPTAAEVIAGTALDITNMIFPSFAKPGQNTNLVDGNRRVGDTKTYQRVGTTTYAGGAMTYAFGAQAATGADGKKLWEKIPEGTTCYLVERIGVANATAPATGQFVNVFPVEFGPSLPTREGDGEAAESSAVATYAIYDGPNGTGPVFSVALT